MATPTLVTTAYTTLDDADANTQWSADRNLSGPDTELYYEASGSMGCTIQAASNADEIWITKSSGSWDLSNTHIRLWYFFTAVGQLDTDANGGIQIGVDDGTNTGWWYVSGSDTYGGGWALLQVDTRLTVDSGTKPTMNAVTSVRVKTVLTSSPKNAQNLWTDFWTETDGNLGFYGGSSGGGANDVTLADLEGVIRPTGYGTIYEYSGVYFATGGIEIGAASQTTYFRQDDEILIFVDNDVDTDFYEIVSVTGTSTNIDINGGFWASVADSFDIDFATSAPASLDIDSLTVSNKGGTVDLASGQSMTNCKLIGPGAITPSTATFQSNIVDSPTAAITTSADSDLRYCSILTPTVAADGAAVAWNGNYDPNGNLDGMTFSKGTNDHHAIEFGTSSPTTMTLTDIDFSGFTNTVGHNAAPLHIKRTSGTVTINLTGCTGITASGYKSAGATVDIVLSPRTVKVLTQTTAGADVASANVFLRTKTGGTGPFPENDTVTIVNSGTTATVTHTAHGMATNDYVLIADASLDANNGVFQITVSDANTYTYTMASSPGSNPTGTIKAWFVFLKGTTDANGEISMSRSISSDQDVEGWARKSTSTPYYKNAVINGVVSASQDTTFTAVMVLDE